MKALVTGADGFIGSYLVEDRVSPLMRQDERKYGYGTESADQHYR